MPTYMPTTTVHSTTVHYRVMVFYTCDVFLLLILSILTCSIVAVDYEGTMQVFGYRIEPTDSRKTISKLDYEPSIGAFRVPRGHELRLRIYGSNVKSFNSIAFTRRAVSFASTDNSSGKVTFCDKLGHSRAFTLSHESDGDQIFSAVANVYFETDASAHDVVYYFCLEHNATDVFIHQGDKMALVVYHLQPYILPLPLQLCLICFCLTLSWLFSGLNLGLMSLDCTELKLIMRCGSEDDRRFAKALEPIRRRGNTLLCTILLANTIVNSSYTLLLDDVVGEGIYALLGSTIGIVIFGEILPQAVCSRYGLKVGYYTRWIVQIFMYGLYPLTLSIGKLLDCIFGHEIHQVYSRDKLREIVLMSAQVDNDGSISNGGDISGGHLKPEEVKIVTGALQMNETTVKDIMKSRSEIFMLDINEVIDYDLVALIARNGYTRIPIYANGDRDYIVGLLNAKDLLGIDPEDKLPLNSLIEFYGREVIRVEEDRTVLAMLNTFKEAKVHLAIVDHVDPGDENHDPSRTISGIVTLEDVIEFILRDEIVDETDVLKDVLRHEEQVEKAAGVKCTGHPSAFLGDHAEIIPQQLATAASQFLMANVEPFRKEIVERKVLARLLRFPGLFVIKKYRPECHSDNFLYSYNQPADFFALILQGSCHVYIGKEQLPFEAGPFHFFGLEALAVPYEPYTIDNTTPLNRSRSDSLTSISPNYCSELTVFRPDFTVEITSDVQYVRLTLAMYRALTSVSRIARHSNKADDPVFVIDKLRLEMQQMLNSGGAPTPATPFPVTSNGVNIVSTVNQGSSGLGFRKNSINPGNNSTASLFRLANLKRGSIAQGTPDRQISCVEFIKPQRPATALNGKAQHDQFAHARSGSLVGINRFLSEMPMNNHTSPLMSKRFLDHLQSNEDVREVNSDTANSSSHHNYRAVPGSNRHQGASFVVGSSRSLLRTSSNQHSESSGSETVPRAPHHNFNTFYRTSCDSLPNSPSSKTITGRGSSHAHDQIPTVMVRQPSNCSPTDPTHPTQNRRRLRPTAYGKTSGEKARLIVPKNGAAYHRSDESSSICSSDQIVSDDAASLEDGSYSHNM